METTSRVNSGRLGDYIGQKVRLVCKVKTADGSSAIVEASDGGQVEVKLPTSTNMTDTYVEIIGSVEDHSTVKMLACVNLGDSMDMKIANDAVELMHDDRFKEMFM